MNFNAQTGFLITNDNILLDIKNELSDIKDVLKGSKPIQRKSHTELKDSKTVKAITRLSKEIDKSNKKQKRDDKGRFVKSKKSISPKQKADEQKQSKLFDKLIKTDGKESTEKIDLTKAEELADNIGDVYFQSAKEVSGLIGSVVRTWGATKDIASRAWRGTKKVFSLAKKEGQEVLSPKVEKKATSRGLFSRDKREEKKKIRIDKKRNKLLKKSFLGFGFLRIAMNLLRSPLKLLVPAIWALSKLFPSLSRLLKGAVPPLSKSGATPPIQPDSKSKAKPKSGVPKVPKGSSALKFAKGTAIIATLVGIYEAFQLWNNKDLKVDEKLDKTTEVVGGVAGAVAGSAVGAVVGSFIPIIGTAIGGFLGGIAGYFGGSSIGDYLGDLLFLDKKDAKGKDTKEQSSSFFNSSKYEEAQRKMEERQKASSIRKTKSVTVKQNTPVTEKQKAITDSRKKAKATTERNQKVEQDKTRKDYEKLIQNSNKNTGLKNSDNNDIISALDKNNKILIKAIEDNKTVNQSVISYKPKNLSIEGTL